MLAAYDTLQPNNLAQQSNTGDIDGDNSCGGTDIPLLKTVSASKIVSAVFNSWGIVNLDLPEAPTELTHDTDLPFRLSVRADKDGGPTYIGRAGMIVKVEVTNAVGTVTLSGRHCDPELNHSMPDQLNTEDHTSGGGGPADPMCALGVAITNYTGTPPYGGAEVGATEDGTYGLQVNGSSGATATLKVTFPGQILLNIPATEINIDVVFETIDFIDISNCLPNPAEVGQLVQCDVASFGGNPQLDPINDTCGGWLPDQWTYEFTVNEFHGDMCDAAVELGGQTSIKDSETVVLFTENRDPYWTTTPSDLEVIGEATYDAPNGVAADDNIPKAAPGDPGYVTCSADNNTCSFPITITGSGAGEATCNINFTTGSNAEICAVDIIATDGHGASISQNITITVDADNHSPYWTTVPSDVTLDTGIGYDADNGAAADDDLPNVGPGDPGYICCSATNNTCSFTPAVTGCGVGAVTCHLSFTDNGPEVCTVDIVVEDSWPTPLSVSETITITLNPLISIDCSNPGPNPVVEGNEMQCTVTSIGGTAQIDDSNDDCEGTLSGTGPWMYSYTPDEADGPGTCVAAVELVEMGTIKDSKVVNIEEDNQDPYWTTAPSNVTLDGNSSYNSPNGEAADDDLPNSGPGDPGYLICSSANSTCSFSVTVTGSGAGAATCNMSFNVGNEETCAVDIRATDGYGNQISQNITIMVEQFIDISNCTPNPVDEGTAVSCDVAAVGGTPDVDTANDDCGGAINGTGPWTYDFTPTEAQGPGNCTAAVELVENNSFNDSEVVVVNEVNQTPYWTTVPGDLALNTGYSYNMDNGAAADGDLPNAVSGEPGFIECSADNNGCTFPVTITGSGAGVATCNMSFTTVGEETCTVDVVATDGYSDSISQAVTITVYENRSPYWTTTPVDLIVRPGFIYDEVVGVSADDDLPNAAPGDRGFIECSDANDTCSFPITITGSGAGVATCNMSFTSGDPEEICGVDVVVTDGYGLFISETVSITVSKIWYVDIDAGGAGTGLTWTDAFNVVQDAMDAATTEDAIWVAEGTYTRPIGGTEPVLTMKDGVLVYGGFDGTETELSERNPTTHETILDGEDTSYHVVVGASDARLDGFTVTRGNAIWAGSLYPDNAGGGMLNDNANNLEIVNCIFSGNSAWRGSGMENSYSDSNVINCTFTGNSTQYGGGMVNSFSYPTITNCYFLNNPAGVRGGGMHNVNGSSPTIINCTFNDNSAYDGGGMHNYDSSSPSITDCTFTGNSATNYGGGMINDTNASPTITNCSFENNSAGYGGGVFNQESSPDFLNCVFKSNNTITVGTTGQGGGMENYINSSPVITNCVFTGNNAENRGGGMLNATNSSPVITNCTFAGNSAKFGGAISNMYAPTLPLVTNCIMWGNMASDSGPEVYNYDGGAITINYTDIAGGYAGTGNIDLDPYFVATDDLHLQLGSPCIDTGTASGAPSDDIEGNPRPTGPGYDMGAYEYQLPPYCIVVIHCPTNVDETDPISCPAFYNDVDCTGTLSLGGGDTCTGAGVADYGDGTGLYTAPLQGETAGPGYCTAEVELAADAVSDSDNIVIDEVNQNPYWTTAPSNITIDGNTAYNSANGDAADDDEPNGSAGDPGYVSCGYANNTCLFITALDVTGSGTGAATCNVSFTAGNEEVCTVDIVAEDGYGAQAVQNITITVEQSIDISNCTPNPADEGVLVSCDVTATGGIPEPDPVADDCNGNVNGAGPWTYDFIAWETHGSGSCTAAIQLAENNALKDFEVVDVNEVNQSPYWTIMPSPIAVGIGLNYDYPNGHASDNDVPNASPGDPGYVMCSSDGDTCSFPITVTGEGTGALDCNISFTAGLATEECDLDLKITDGWGVYTISSVPISIFLVGPGWIGTSTLGNLGGISNPADPRIINNYPADWGQVTLNFNFGPIATCNADVTCDSGPVAVTGTPDETDCIITAGAGYWPSGELCTVENVVITPACSNCAGATQSWVNSLREQDCSTFGGTCGGFIDDGTYGTGSTIEIQTVKKEDFSPLVGAGGDYHVYALVEQNYADPALVQRVEAFDDNDDGVITVNAPTSGPAKITVGYRGNAGNCSMNQPSVERDCFQITTYADIDARKIVVPVEYTTTESRNLPKYYINGDVGIGTFRSKVLGDPGLGFPDPMRMGIVVPVYKNQSLGDLNMDAIFQPETEERTITVCYGPTGHYDITLPIDLPKNIILPDIIRDDWTAGCSGGSHNSGPDTSWRYYTNERDTTLTVMVLGGLANSSLCSLDLGLNIAQFPIFIKAFGSRNAPIPATYNNGDSYTFPGDEGSTPLEIDYRDPDIAANGRANGGHSSGTGVSLLATVDELVVDRERIRRSGATPPYLDPNRWEQANRGWGGQDVRLGGVLLSQGGRVPAVQPTDPGGLVAYQIHMTSQIDDRRFTVFQRGHATGRTSYPFTVYTNDNPWSGSSTDTGVISERNTGIPPSAVDPGGELDFSEVQDAVGVSSRRPMVYPWLVGLSAVPFVTPGNSTTSKVVGDIVDGSTVGVTEFLARPEITDPGHNGYYLPAQYAWSSFNVPINRNGEMYRGTAVSPQHRIHKYYGNAAPYYFELSNPTLNVDASRYPDYFTLYVVDGYGTLDPRSDPKDPEGAEYHGYPKGGTGRPKNRVWRIYGNLKGSLATYTVTLPIITPGLRTIGGTQGYVPDPFQGATALDGKTLEWELTSAIIGTDPAEGGVTSVFDFQNQDFNWHNTGAKHTSNEAHQFIWQD